MSCRLVCRVKLRGQAERQEVEFVWFEGSASFPPIVLNHEETAAFRENTRDAREKLFQMVSLHVPAAGERDAGAIQHSCFELAMAGRYLYNQLLPTHDPTGADVRKWLEDLVSARKVESLEVVCDGEPWFVPWNLVYDQDPDDGRFEGRGLDLDEQFGPFWGIRHNLCGGLPVNPLRRNPLPAVPDMLLVIDPVVSEALRARADQPGRDEPNSLEAIAEEVRRSGARVRCVGSKPALKQALKAHRPDVMYWLCHADPDKLWLGDENITLKDLDNLLNEVQAIKSGTGLVILNACRTAEAGTLGSFLKSFHDRGYCGIIATEGQTLDVFANPFGLGLLQGIMSVDQNIVATTRSLRRRSLPLGLLYGTYCPPSLRMSRPEQAAAADVGLEQVALAATRQAVALATAPERTPTASSLERPDDSRRRWPPLPAVTPYLPLGIYGPEHRALFAGRDEDIERFALLLDHPETRILVLHGESGVGKSSFLRAGVLPYLEDECIGYQVLRDRTERREYERSRVLFVRSTEDPMGRLSEALRAFCHDPYEYVTPNNATVQIDLPERLARAIAARGVFGSTIAAVRQALDSDPDGLSQVLSAVATDLPFTLVVVIDQAEEMFTLGGDDRQVARRDHFLESVRRVAGSSGPVKLIISLRTEFYGRLVDRLRRGIGVASGTREYLLTDLHHDELVEAICRPTLAHGIRYSNQVPFQVYGFRYAARVPEAIAAELIREGRRDGVLPLVQFLCDQLYRRVAGRSDPTVTMEDFEGIGRLRGGLRRHLEHQIQKLAPGNPSDQEAFKQLLARLTHQQSDGTLTTELLREDRLAAHWQGSTPFAEILRNADGLRLLRLSTQRRDDGREERYISLGHDALARVADTWREERARRARIRKMTGIAALSSVVAACMALLAIFAWIEMRRADKSYRDAVVAKTAAEASERRLRLQSTIRDAIGRFDGNEEDLARIDSLIAQLGKIVPAEVAAQNHLLNAQLARTIEAEIDRAYGKLTVPDVSRIEQRVQRLVDDSPNLVQSVRQDVHWIRRRLVSSYRSLGRDDEALRIVNDVLTEPLMPADRLGLMNEYCWMKIRAGRPADALPLLDRFLEKSAKEYDAALEPLLIERARVRVALGQYDRAERDVDELLKEFPTDRFTYPIFADACLVRGALRDHRGEPTKALEIWRKGRYRAWPFRWTQDISSASKLEGRAMDTRNYVAFYTIVMGAATGDVTEADIGFAFQLQLGLDDAVTALGRNVLTSKLDFLAMPNQIQMLNKCFSSPRGRDFLKRLAFRQLAYNDPLQESFLLAVMSYIRLSAMTDGFPDDVEPLLWNSFRNGAEHFRTQRMTAQVIALLLTYSGNTGVLGWGSLRQSLDPDLIPTVAFVLGHRYRVLNLPKEARMFFGLVVEKTEAGSPLRKRALEAIEKFDQNVPR